MTIKSKEIAGLLAETRFNPTADKVMELTQQVNTASSLEREHALLEHVSNLLASLKQIKEAELSAAIAEQNQPQEGMTCH